MRNFSRIADRSSLGQKMGRSLSRMRGGFGQIGIREFPALRMKTGGKQVFGAVVYAIDKH